MTARHVLVAVLATLAAAMPLAGGPAPVSRRDSPRVGIARPATVEPTPPVLIRLRLESIERAGSEASARLVVEVESQEPVRDLDLRLILPQGMSAPDDTALPRRPMDLSRGDHLGFVLPIRGPADRNLPIRVEGDFHLVDGGPVRVGQGVTLEGVPAPQGRSHLGAWEVPAVPLEDLHR